VLTELYPAETAESEVPADESKNTDHTQASASDEAADATSGSAAQE